MDKKVLVDTDIIIKSCRGNSVIYNQLPAIKEKFAISVVTAFQLKLREDKIWEFPLSCKLKKQNRR